MLGAVKVPRTATLDALLNPKLNTRESIFSKPVRPPIAGEKIYDLSPADIDAIRKLRGAVTDLHPGMGGIAPEKLIRMIEVGNTLTSLDYMLTKSCNFECTWCFAESGPREREYLPFELLKATTEEARDLGVGLFVLTGGEPLMYRDPELGKLGSRGAHFFRVVEMIERTYKTKSKNAKILTFDDVALVTPEIATKFAAHGIGLCTKGDTLIAELQDFKINQIGGFEKMRRGYRNLIEAGYGRDPNLRLVVNSVLDHTTFDGMLDLHMWVMENGFDHSIVPVHYCGSAEDEDQEIGIHSPHVHVLYQLISRIDARYFATDWSPWSAFSYNKTCNRNRSGLHIRSTGDVTACSESPPKEDTGRYTFGNIRDREFSLRALVGSDELAKYRREFSTGHGTYVCSPQLCDLYAGDLCQGGCATRSAYSRVDYETGLIVKNTNHHNYSEKREDPLCPAWTLLALRQGALREGLLESIHDRLLTRSTRLDIREFPFEPA